MALGDKLSNYPNGFTNGVTIRGLPVQVVHPGKAFYVNKSGGTLAYGQQSTGSNSNKGTLQAPFATIDKAINSCVASRGDVIYVLPGHAETVADATTLVPDVAGVAIVGLGACLLYTSDAADDLLC